MRTLKTHFALIFNDQDDESLCGLSQYENPTTEWEDVTCKRCLKLKGVRG